MEESHFQRYQPVPVSDGMEPSSPPLRANRWCITLLVVLIVCPVLALSLHFLSINLSLSLMLPGSLIGFTAPTSPEPSSSPDISLHLLHRALAYRQFHPRWKELFAEGEESQLRAAYFNRSTVDCGLLRGTEVGNWSVSPEHELRYDPHHCRLRRPSHKEALQCMSGQSLLWMGDSLTRYQYMSFITFLSQGMWPEPLGSMPSSPNPCLEREWLSWEDYFKASVQLFGGEENCTCARGFMERRHYYNKAHDVTVRVLATVVAETVQLAVKEAVEEWHSPAQRPHYTYTGHVLTPELCNETTLPNNATGCAYPPSSFAPYRPAGVLIANTGIWQKASSTSVTRSYNISQSEFYWAIRDEMRPPEGRPVRAIWRMTGAERGGGEHEVGVFAAQMTAFTTLPLSPWEILDAYSATAQPVARNAYWDVNHYLPFMYEQANIFLLNMLCDESWQFVSTKRT